MTCAIIFIRGVAREETLKSLPCLGCHSIDYHAYAGGGMARVGLRAP